MGYIDLNGIHNPSTGGVAPAAWGDQVRDNFEAHEDPPVCSVSASVAQTVTSGSATALTADVENFDNDAMHSTVTNTSRITIQTEGRYLFISTVVFAAGGAGTRQIVFRIDGVTSLGGQLLSPAASGSTRLCAPFSSPLTVGQYLEVVVVQTQGANLGVTLNEFAAMRMTR
jgi:hypothetical protein